MWFDENTPNPNPGDSGGGSALLSIMILAFLGIGAVIFAIFLFKGA